MKQVINQLNYSFTNNQVAELNRQKSETIPEQAMTVQQIMDRFTKGLPVTAKNYEAQYHGNIYSPDINAMDLVDQQELREYARDKVKEFNKKIEDEIKAKNQKTQDEFKKWQEEKTKVQSTNQSTEEQILADN